LSSAPLGNGGKRVGSVVITRDMTEIERLRSTTEALRKGQETLKLATEAANLGLCDFYPQDEQVSYDPFVEAMHPDDRERIKATLREAVAHGGDGRLEMEFRAIRPSDGQERWFRCYGKVFWDSAGRSSRLVGVTLDITESKFAEQRIREASQHDPLTGLPNRATLFEYCRHLLALAKAHGQQCALLFIVVGKGIESEASFDYLREQGCDPAQGYFFSKPLSAEEFERWYREGQLQHGAVH
jgi:PAS domain S-box-containing protein